MMKNEMVASVILCLMESYLSSDQLWLPLVAMTTSIRKSPVPKNDHDGTKGEVKKLDLKLLTYRQSTLHGRSTQTRSV